MPPLKLVQIQSQCIQHDHRRAESHPSKRKCGVCRGPREPGYFTGHTFRESGLNCAARVVVTLPPSLVRCHPAQAGVDVRHRSCAWEKRRICSSEIRSRSFGRGKALRPQDDTSKNFSAGGEAAPASSAVSTNSIPASRAKLFRVQPADIPIPAIPPERLRKPGAPAPEVSRETCETMARRH